MNDQPQPGDRGRWALRWLPAHVGRLLDVGCASGYFTVHFARRADQTWAVDVDEADLAEARRAYPGIYFQMASAANLPFPIASFDVVIMLDVLEHVPDDRAALAEVSRVTRPGGVLILSVPHRGFLTVADPDNLEYRFPGLYRRLTGTPASPDASEHRHYTLAHLAQLLVQAGFRVERVHRSSLVLYPLALWMDAAAVRLWGSDHPLRGLLGRLRDVSYAVPCGPAAYNLMVRAVKQDV
jgi:SAM-dependent methyltransferase